MSQWEPRPTKPRPKKRWWVVGALLLVAALAVFVVGLWRTISSATATDAVVDATRTPVQVEVEAGTERMLYVPEDQLGAGCALSDASGTPLTLSSTGATTTVTTEGRTWRGVGTFTSPSAEVTVDCVGSPPGSLVRVGAPLGAGFAAGLVVTILVPMVLGLAGVAVLVTTTVLWVTRKPGQPGPQPGPQQPGWTPPPGPPSPPPPAW